MQCGIATIAPGKIITNNMRTTFVLVIKEDLIIKTYTAMRAIHEEFSKEEIGVSRSVLEKFDFDKEYENDLVKIVRSSSMTTGEIRRKKHAAHTE